jgi:hypothetical protein
VLKHAGQELDSDQESDGGPAGDDPVDRGWPGRGDVRGQAGGGADGKGGPGQPAGPASGTPVGEQDQQGHDLDPVHRQGKGVGMPPGLPVGPDQHPHVAIADRPGKARESGDGDAG